MFIHFEDVRRDRSGMIREIATFLGIEIDSATWPAILDHTSFEWMKANATASVPLGGAFWDGGAQVFVHKGTNGRWRNLLPAELSEAYEARALAELGPDCAAWLAGGRTAVEAMAA